MARNVKRNDQARSRVLSLVYSVRFRGIRGSKRQEYVVGKQW